MKPFDFCFYEHTIPPTLDMLKHALAGATGVKIGEFFVAADDGTELPYFIVMLHKYKQIALNLQNNVTIRVISVHDSNEPKRHKLIVVT